MPIAAIIDHPTFGAFSTFLVRWQHVQCSRPGRLVVLNDGDPSRTIVLVPAGRGAAVGLRSLADHLEPKQLVLGFDYPGAAPGQPAASTVEDLADRLIQLLDTVKDGYSLVGLSFGGLVAFDVARRQGRGPRAPTCTIIVDAVAPSRRARQEIEWLRRARKRFPAHASASAP